jgi:hypothetical protein
MQTFKSFRYKNILFAILGLIFAVILSRYEPFHEFLLNLQDFGYIGAFFAGLLFVSTFTFATGAIILLIFAERLNPIELALIAGLGGVVGDFLIFKYIKNDLKREIEEIYKSFGGSHISKLFHTKYFNWTLPFIGAALIASPIPDELGVSLMGISKMSTKKFLLIAFILDFIGVFLVISASNFIKP